MSQEALQVWKQRVANFQMQTRFQPPANQGELLGMVSEASGSYQLTLTATATATAPTENDPLAALSPPEPDPINLNPFALPQQNINFWQYPTHESGGAALYFVIDYEATLLLYIGETLRSHKRWKGVHDCKRYLSHYRQVHYEHHLVTRLGIGFWGEAPVNTKSRQRLERSLIDRWRSPFNKENWTLWGTPFVS
jgi:hypothetical protein